MSLIFIPPTNQFCFWAAFNGISLSCSCIVLYSDSKVKLSFSNKKENLFCMIYLETYNK